MLGVTGIIHSLGLLLELTAEKSPETNKSQHSLPFQMSQSLYSSHLKLKDCWFWGNRARTSKPVAFFDNIFIAFSNWQSHPRQHVLNHSGTRSPVVLEAILRVCVGGGGGVTALLGFGNNYQSLWHKNVSLFPFFRKKILQSDWLLSTNYVFIRLAIF